MNTTKLSAEIARLLEAGANKHLDRSFVYSPFRLFFNLFKKSNPQFMEQARAMVRDDVMQNLQKINGFDEAVFIVDGKATKLGNDLLKACYNIGICLVKEELTVRKAFKIIRNAEEREQIYQYVLRQVKDAAMKLLNERKLGSENGKVIG